MPGGGEERVRGHVSLVLLAGATAVQHSLGSSAPSAAEGLRTDARFPCSFSSAQVARLSKRPRSALGFPHEALSETLQTLRGDMGGVFGPPFAKPWRGQGGEHCALGPKRIASLRRCPHRRSRARSRFLESWKCEESANLLHCFLKEVKSERPSRPLNLWEDGLL